MGEGRASAWLAVWHPRQHAGLRRWQAFRQPFPEAAPTTMHALRMQVMVEMLAAAIERAGRTDHPRGALSGARFDGRALGGRARHGCAQPTTSSSTAGGQHDAEGQQPGVRFDSGGSGLRLPHLRRHLEPDQTAHRVQDGPI